jgi:hypothetical protein
MIGPYKINWAELSSLDFDVWTELSFDEDSGQTSTFLNRENITTEHYDGRRTIHRSKHQEILTATITLIKQDYSDFDFDENRRILSWLTSSETPGYLEVFHDDSEVVSYRLFGNWTDIEQYKLGNGRVVGYVATFESSAPYAYSQNFIYPEIHETIAEISENILDNDWLEVRGVADFTINCETDEYGKVLYPKVTVQFDSDEYVSLAENPIRDGYTMLPNVIYKYLDDNKFYIHIPDAGVKSQLYAVYEGTPTEVNISDDTNSLGEYCYFNNSKAVYRAVAVCEKAVSYNSEVTYFIDDKGLTKADPQPTNETDLQEQTYYVQSKDTNNNPIFNWDFIASVGAGIRIENTSVKNALNDTTTTELIGCTVTHDEKIGEEIVFDGTNKVISSSLTSLSTFGRIFSDDFNWVWPPLAYGDNNFVVTGNCKIRFEWIEPRKVGSL